MQLRTTLQTRHGASHSVQRHRGLCPQALPVQPRVQRQFAHHSYGDTTHPLILPLSSPAPSIEDPLLLMLKTTPLDQSQPMLCNHSALLQISIDHRICNTLELQLF